MSRNVMKHVVHIKDVFPFERNVGDDLMQIFFDADFGVVKLGSVLFWDCENLGFV